MPASCHEQPAHYSSRHAASLVDLPPPQAHRAHATHGLLQVTIQVAVPLSRRVVEEPPVKLNDQPERFVVDVPIDVARRERHTRLSRGLRQPVRALNAPEIAVFEDGCRPSRDLSQRCLQPGSAAESGTRVEGGAQPCGCCEPTPAARRQGFQRSKVRHLAGGDIQQGVLDPDAGRARLPVDAPCQGPSAYHSEAVDWCDATISGYGDADGGCVRGHASTRPTRRTHGRRPGQGRRGEMQDAHPCALGPRERTGVVHEYARKDPDQVPSPHHPLQVGGTNP